MGARDGGAEGPGGRRRGLRPLLVGGALSSVTLGVIIGGIIFVTIFIFAAVILIIVVDVSLLLVLSLLILLSLVLVFVLVLFLCYYQSFYYFLINFI